MRLCRLVILLMLIAPAAWAHGVETHEDEATAAAGATEVAPDPEVEARVPAVHSHGEDVPADHHDMDDGHHGETSPSDHHETAEDHHGESSAANHHGDGEHDHSAHAGESWADGPIERALEWAGKFHPALTNFPIALLIMALLAEAWGMVRGGTSMRAVGRFLATSGGFAAVVTAAVGWLFVGFNMGADDPLLSIHRLVGSLAGVSGLAAMIVGLRTADADGRNLLRVTVLIAAALVAYNGYLGGQMLYGIDHYDWPA